MDWPGEKIITKAIDKLTDVVSKGTGGALAPWQIKRVSLAEVEAQRDKLLMLAQTEQDIEDIKSGKKQYTEDHKLVNANSKDNIANTEIKQNNGRLEPYVDFDYIDKQSQKRKKSQRIQEEINLTKTVLIAEQELASGSYEANDEPVDPDWFTRWCDSAEKVSNEDLQKLWARALAGEVTTPGSFSLRTLEFLKNLSQAEAKQISKLAPYVVDGTIFKHPYLDQNGLDFVYFLEMEDLGLISGLKGGGLDLKLDSLVENEFTQNFQYGGKVLLISKESPTSQLRLRAIKVTRLGNEVLKLGVFPFDYQYFETIGDSIKNKGFLVSLADITGFSPGKIHFTNERKL